VANLGRLCAAGGCLADLEEEIERVKVKEEEKEKEKEKEKVGILLEVL